MDTKIIPFGATLSQMIIISETDRLISRADWVNYQVTIVFCDFVAVWTHAFNEGFDLIGEVTFVDGSEVTKDTKGVAEYLRECGYESTSDMICNLLEYIPSRDKNHS